MKNKILRYYRNIGRDVPKLILRKPPHLLASQVEAGAVKLYDDIKQGEVVKPINISRRVYREAETVLYREFEEDHEILENTKTILADLSKKNLQLWVLCGLLIFGMAVVILMKINGC